LFFFSFDKLEMNLKAMCGGAHDRRRQRKNRRRVTTSTAGRGHFCHFL